MKTMIRAMKALSDPNRVRVMKMLELRELCVCEITAILGLAQSTVSKHLKILEDADLIESWREGSWVNYRLATESGNPYAETMQHQLRNWLADDRQINEDRKRVTTVDRLRICAA